MDETSDVAEARALLSAARYAALATLNADGSPFASLVTVGTAADGAPLFLLSALARHTRNLLADPRASLLVAAASEHPMAAPRLSLGGRMAPAAAPALRERFLLQHPDARAYADFADFALWRLSVADAHLVAGFGRIRALAPAAVISEGLP